MNKEQRIKSIGILGIIFMIIVAGFIAFNIGFVNPDFKKIENEKPNKSDKLDEPVSVSPIPEKSKLRVEFTKKSYNESVSKINETIKKVKKNTAYLVDRSFCDDLGSLRSQVGVLLPNIQLDINYNSNYPKFEKIVNDTRPFEIACEQHLAGSTGLLEDYKKQYPEYLKNLIEIEKDI